MAGETWGEDDEVVPDDNESLWEAAREAVGSALKPSLSTQQMLEGGPAAMGAAPPEVLAENAAAFGTGAASAASVAGLARLGVLGAAKVLGGGYVGGEVGEKVGGAVGSPRAGALIGSLVGGGVGGFLRPQTIASAMAETGVPGMGGRLVQAALKEAPKAAVRAEQAAATAATASRSAAPSVAQTAATGLAPRAQAALPLAERMKESVLLWKHTHKLSGAQIQKFLRETYGKEIDGGMSMAQAGKIRDMVLGAGG